MGMLLPCWGWHDGWATGPSLDEPVLLVFQQAEETHPSGAQQVLQGMPPELLPLEFIGFHLWPELPAGVIGLRPGPMLGSVAGVTILVFGSPGRVHGTAFGTDVIDALGEEAAVGEQALVQAQLVRSPGGRVEQRVHGRLPADPHDLNTVFGEVVDNCVDPRLPHHGQRRRTGVVEDVSL